MTINARAAQAVATAMTNAQSTTETNFQASMRDILTEVEYLNQRDTEMLTFVVRDASNNTVFAMEGARPKTDQGNGVSTDATRDTLTDGSTP